jgi:hypothetical protein
LEALLSPKHEEQSNEIFFDLNTTYTYIKVLPHSNPDLITKMLNQQLAPQFKILPFQSPNASYTFELQPLSEITPGYSIANGMGKGLPIHLVKIPGINGVCDYGLSHFQLYQSYPGKIISPNQRDWRA